MTKRMRCALVLLMVVAGALAIFAEGATAQGSGTIAEKTKDAQKFAGYFNLYWDPKTGKLWLEIDK